MPDRESKTRLQLEAVVADLAGFDQKVIMIVKSAADGDFTATVTGTTAGVSKSRAQADVNAVCVRLRTKYRLAE